jgi:hypothetical protein
MYTPAQALTAKQVESMVKWAGCNAPVYTSYDESVLSSFYRSGDGIYIGLGTAPRLTDEMMMVVIFHETGHCLQDQLGYLYSMRDEKGTVAVELDADRWAAQLLCGYRMDGKQLLHDIFVWAYKTYGYDGDWNHGTIWERISQGNNADYCRVDPVQAG